MLFVHVYIHHPLHVCIYACQSQQAWECSPCSKVAVLLLGRASHHSICHARAHTHTHTHYSSHLLLFVPCPDGMLVFSILFCPHGPSVLSLWAGKSHMPKLSWPSSHLTFHLPDRLSTYLSVCLAVFLPAFPSALFALLLQIQSHKYNISSLFLNETLKQAIEGQTDLRGIFSATTQNTFQESSSICLFCLSCTYLPASPLAFTNHT